MTVYYMSFDPNYAITTDRSWWPSSDGKWCVHDYFSAQLHHAVVDDFGNLVRVKP